jgi:hypothetical protein
MAGNNEGIFKRPYVSNGQNLPRPGFAGSGWLANPRPIVSTQDIALTLTTDQISSGWLTFSSFTAARVVTTPTAAQIIAAMGEDFSIGDTYVFLVSVATAFAATWAAGAGVTLQGSAATEAGTFSLVAITRTGAATVNWNVA